MCLFLRTSSFLALFIISGKLSFSQKQDSIPDKKKISLVFATEAFLYTGSMVVLNEMWYKKFPRSSFHFFNDGKEWLQLDKIGHSYTSYQCATFSYYGFKKLNIPENKSIIYGAIQSFILVSSIEVFDGFSSEWGASPYDLIANASGLTLFSFQQHFWKEQKILMKFSYSHSGLANLRPSVLGSSLTERILKDYNGQTFWLSANINSFIKKEFIPKWLNIAIGYGADGMLSGASDSDENYITSKERERHYYLSFDIDFTRFNLKNKYLRNICKVFNLIKIPFPAIDLSKNKIQFHPYYF